MVQALLQLQGEDVDVIIVARGGGSAEDLWAFNDERIARAIYASRVPVISAIGHETDITVADMVADHRASTPSVAAEIVAPDSADLSLLVNELSSRARQCAIGRIDRALGDLFSLQHRLSLASPTTQLAAMRSTLMAEVTRMESSVGRTVERKAHQVDRAAALLHALDPNQLLRHGYAHISNAETNETIRSAAMLSRSDSIRATFADGSALATIEDVATATPNV